MCESLPSHTQSKAIQIDRTLEGQDQGYVMHETRPPNHTTVAIPWLHLKVMVEPFCANINALGPVHVVIIWSTTLKPTCADTFCSQSSFKKGKKF